VRQNFRDALTKRLRSEIALNSPSMANGNAARPSHCCGALGNGSERTC
jgi:hypothetical protein